MADWPYNTANWQRLRAVKLAHNPECQPCAALGRMSIANTVDHNVPVSAGGPAFPSIDKLTSMCASCHSSKTARGVEAGAARTKRAVKPRKGCDINGRPLDPSHPWNVALREKSLEAAEARTACSLPTQLVSPPDGRNG